MVYQAKVLFIYQEKKNAKQKIIIMDVSILVKNYQFGFFKNKLIKFACETVPICIVNLVGYSKCTFGENYQV